MEGASATLEPLFAFLAHALATAETTFNKLPGSAVIQRYVKSSHQNDPGRTILELILIIFAIRTLLQSRTRADRNGKHFIQFSDKACSSLTCFLVKGKTDNAGMLIIYFVPSRKSTNSWTNGHPSPSPNPSLPSSRLTWLLCPSWLAPMAPNRNWCLRERRLRI